MESTPPDAPVQAPTAGGQLSRLAAFTRDPAGGNPAGVWIGDALPDAASMQRIAADVGFSETAFVAPAHGARRTVRYFSPAAEVPFCGHATIAAGVRLGETDGEGSFRLATLPGEIEVVVRTRDGTVEAALTSVPPQHAAAAPALVDEALAALRWTRADLDPAIAPVRAFAGAWHLLLVAATRSRLARLDYDFAALQALCRREQLITLQLVWRESATVFHARNPFPFGGVVEDPATGAAAAALGGFLRDAGLQRAPTRLLIRQGEDMGRPSQIRVEVPQQGGIVVTGNAVHLR